MRIGPYEIHSIETGRFALDGGAMFGVVPKNLWSKTNPPDEQNRITLAMRCLLLLHEDGRKILIDNGVGHKYSEKFASIYRIDHSQFTLEASLLEYGLSTNDITDVLLTHLHFDHAGGSTKVVNGEVVPTFENAKYYVQNKHYDWGKTASEKDRASFIKADYEILATSKRMIFLAGEDCHLPNIRFFIANGHSPNQQLPIVYDDHRSIFFCGDLIPTMTHVAVPYVMAYDNQPLVTIEEKKHVLNQAVKEKWILFFEHDPATVGATVILDDKGYRVGETQSF